MKLDVEAHDLRQSVGLYGCVCISVRRAFLVESDVAVYRRTFDKLSQRCPGNMAFLQVNRFTPKPDDRVGLDAPAQAAMYDMIRTYGSALRIVAIAMPADPFLVSAMRSTFSRMLLTARHRVDVRILDSVTHAVDAICHVMSAGGHADLQPAKLRNALSEIERGPVGQ